jgi:hypothetical protein
MRGSRMNWMSRTGYEISEKVEGLASSAFRGATEIEIWIRLGKFWVRFLALRLYYPAPLSSFFILFVKPLLSEL